MRFGSNVERFETMTAHVRPETFRAFASTASGDRPVVEGSRIVTVVATGARHKQTRVEWPWPLHTPVQRLEFEALCRVTRQGIVSTGRRGSASISELCIARCDLDGEEGALSTRISIPHRLH